jgi:hypothetical protein
MAERECECERKCECERERDLNAARCLLEKGFSAVLVKDGRILASEKGEGVKPLLMACQAAGADAQGSSLADKVVGVAAARVGIDVGVRQVYGHLMSEGAARELHDAGIAAQWGKLVPFILNRAGDGQCPMERLALSAGSPRDAHQRLLEFLNM